MAGDELAAAKLLFKSFCEAGQSATHPSRFQQDA